MREPSERNELIRAVKKRGEAVSTVAARLGVPARRRTVGCGWRRR